MQTPAELSEELIKSVAYHEAGHAVVAAVEGLSLCEAGMHVDSKANGVAFTFRRNPGDPNNAPADIDQRERSIIMVYAGKIAQEKFAPFSTSALLSGDDAVAEALLAEMYSPPKSEAWNAAQQRLWGESYTLVHEHWKAIETLAETLWSKPTVPRVSRGPLRFDSQDSTEKWMDGHEIKAVLAPFEIACDVLPDSGGIATSLLPQRGRGHGGFNGLVIRNKVVVELYLRRMIVNSHLRSSVILFLGAGASAPLGKLMMGDFVTHLSTIPAITGSNLFQAIATKKRDLEFLLEELGELESKAYIDERKIDPTRTFQSTALEASELIKNIKREVFFHYRTFDNVASGKIASHLLPLFDAASKVLGPGEPLVVFTTNYDPAVEQFSRQASGAYTLFDGFDFDGTLGEVVWSRTAFLNWKPSNTGRRDILLIKLHGSTNWIEHSGRISRGPGPGQIATADDTISNALIYPAQGKVAAAEPFFTAYYLFQHFLRSARCLLAVGYSFRDLDASTRLRAAMIDNERLQVGLVDPYAEDIREMLAKQFIRAVAIPGKYDPTNSHAHLPSSPRGNVVPKIEAFLNEISRLAGLNL